MNVYASRVARFLVSEDGPTAAATAIQRMPMPVASE